MSDELLSRLTADLKPVSSLRVARRLVLGTAIGSAASMVLTALTLGLRPDMAQAVADPPMRHQPGQGGRVRRSQPQDGPRHRQ